MATRRSPAASRRRPRRRLRQSVYRRRRLAALTVLVAVAAVVYLGGKAVFDGGGSGGGVDASDVPVKRLVGQRLMVHMAGTATPQLLRAAREGSIGGVIAFPPTSQNPKLLAKQISKLQKAAHAGHNPSLLVAIDQEGGLIKRLPAGPPTRSPRQIAASGSAGQSRSEGRKTGRYLSRLEFTADLAPVLDVPRSSSSFIAARSFGDNPRTVAKLGTAFADGLAAGGVAATAKHFPGLGSAPNDTDFGASVVAETKREFSRELEPFKAAISAGIAVVMVSNATYPAYGGHGPAVFAPQIVDGLLRRKLGFGGVVISDDLEAGAIRAAKLTPVEAAVPAAHAGVDLLLYARTDPIPQVTGQLQRAVKQGKLNRANLERAYVRIVTLKRKLDRPG